MNAEITLTQDQNNAFELFKSFMTDNSSKVFIIRGYAGTGKTTLIQKIVKELNSKHISFKLMASTGRAAKMMSNIVGFSTNTVHGVIYTFHDFNDDIEKSYGDIPQTGIEASGQLYLTFELAVVRGNSDRRFYIIDESSMISDIASKNITQALFGCGRLLKDLLDVDNNGKFIFVGDNCQLPPIEQTFSPALSSSYIINKFGVKVLECELKKIVRQAADNDIITSAQEIRYLYSSAPENKYYKQPPSWGELHWKGKKDIKIYDNSSSLLSFYVSHLKETGLTNATFLTYSNKRCEELTSIIRPALGFRSSRIEVGDLLLVTQNNYISGLMNGDMVVITQLSNFIERKANLTFRRLEVEELFSKKKYSQLIIEDIIYSGNVNLDQSQQKGLYLDFFFRMKELGIKQKDTSFKNSMLKDPYLNALRSVFGYVLTCHKAQGGEWNDVFIDISRGQMCNPTKATYQWIYTAMTRAKEKLHIANDFYIK